MLSQKNTAPKKKQQPVTHNLTGNGKLNRRNVAPRFSTRPTPPAERPVVPNTLQSYLTSISRYKLLSRDEEQVLFKRLSEGGDSKAAHKLVTSNLRLVVKIALDSLDAPLTDDTDTARIEVLKTSSESLDDTISKKEFETILHQRIAEFKKEMTKRELDIFKRRIFAEDPETLAKIGKRYGISRERVRQIQKHIIAKMKESFKHTLPDYAAYSEGTSGD